MIRKMKLAMLAFTVAIAGFASVAFEPLPPLQARIEGVPQAVKNSHDFTVIAVVENTSGETQHWAVAQHCSRFPVGQWTSDSSLIRIIVNDKPCYVDKNPLMFWDVKPWQIYRWELPLRVTATESALREEGIAFRLGFLPPVLRLDKSCRDGTCSDGPTRKEMLRQMEKERIWSNETVIKVTE